MKNFLSKANFNYSFYEGGSRRCVFFNPVQGAFDGGAVALPLIGYLLGKGFSVLVVDTLSIAPLQGLTFNALCAYWDKALSCLGPVDLIAGDALGGATAQGILAQHWGKQTGAVIALSGATKADVLLNDRLGLLSDLARSGYVEQSETLLMQLVAPYNKEGIYKIIQSGSSADPALAAYRLSYGFELLANIDITSAVDGYQGKLLSLYGELSRLVRACNVIFKQTSRHSARAVPGCGMRPLSEGLSFVLKEISTDLKI